MALSWIGLIFILLLGCGGLILVAVLGKLFFQLISGGNQQQAVTTAGHSSGTGALFGVLAAAGILLTVFALPVLFWVGASKKVTYQSSTTPVTVDVESPPIPEAPAPPNGEATLVQFKSTSTSTENNMVELAEAPITLPRWIKEASTRDIFVVESLPRASEDAAVKDARQKASKLLREKYEEANGPFPVGINAISVGAVRKEYTEQIPWDFSAGSDFNSTSAELQDGSAYRTYLQVDTSSTVLANIYNDWRSNAGRQRVEAVTVAAGLLVGAITLLAIFFRIEKRGFLRRTARFASLLGSAGLVIGSVGVGGEAMSRFEHVDPPSQSSGLEFHTGTYDQTAVGEKDRHQVADRIGFVLLGDQDLGSKRRSKEITKAIAKLVNEFERVDFGVFCESREAQAQFRGEAGRHKRLGESAIQQTIRSGFPKHANFVFPQKTVNNVLEHFGPDRIIIICDEVEEVSEEAMRLVETFSDRVPAELFEIRGDKLVHWNQGKHVDECN